MSFLKKYKTIYFQIIGISVLYYRFEKTFLPIIGIALALLPLVFPKIALKYILFFEKLLHFLGNGIKGLLFTIIFVFIITPLAFIKRLFGKKEITQAIEIVDFKKMW